jgi:glucokinase
MGEQRRWILADASTAGTIRFAWTYAGSGKVEAIRTMSSERHPTFTDALLTFERDEGIPLRGCEFTLAVPAPPAGDAIPVARSRWTISRSGLAAMFGGSVTILNDVAATAWSLLGQSGTKIESLGGSPPADFGKPGRWVLVLLEDGVNAAALDIAEDGRCTVIDGEAGHAGFAPVGDEEYALLRRLRAQRSHVSWECALNGGWQEAHASTAERERWAGMAGAFVGDAVLQLGGWSGVILTGRHVANLRDPLRYKAFTQRMEDKSRYARFVAATARYALPVRDPLEGALALQRTRHAERMPIAA